VTAAIPLSPVAEGVDVCLVSPGLPTSNPRLVKEAEALVRAGYRVHCVVGDYATPLREYDVELVRGTGATMTRVGLGSRISYRARRALQMAAWRVSSVIAGDQFHAWASSPQTMRLTAAARRIKAALYIGHTLPALPAAVLAAESNGAVAGFDAEDCHSLESDNPTLNRIAAAVELRFLKRCVHLTAASPLIAEEYRRQNGVEMTTVLNCFDAPSGFSATRKPWTRERPLSLYWFSQTTGPGRGLEQVVVGAGRAKSAVQLCLRGIVSDDYRERLIAIGRDAGLRIDVSFLAPEHPDRMIPGAAEHDVGLSLELRAPRNRDLCLTNKLFTYMAAGIPQIVSRTAAQSELVTELGDAAIPVDLDRPDQIAAAIDRFADEAGHAAGAAAARRLYRDRYSWSIESPRLVDAVGRAIGTRGRMEGARRRAAVTGKEEAVLTEPQIRGNA
jgi:glycosyltransferase involved in cell wall biosynthesis